MTTASPPDLVVAGGGVIGLAVAWRAASAGLGVTVVDPDPGRGASWAAAGMLGPVGEAHFGEDALTRLNVAAARGWPEFVADLESASGRSVHFQAGGTLLVAADASDRAAVDDVLRYQVERGLAARRLTSAECRAAEPLLAPGIRAGVALADDHQVDNRRVVEALLEACRGARVSFVQDEVDQVTSGPPGVTGVALRWGGRLDADAVVLAAGCHTGRIGGLAESLRPPVRPVKGMTLRLRAPVGAPRLRRTVRGLVRGRPCYLVPRTDGTVVVGATVEEKGFDRTVQAGPVADLLDDARRLIPAVEEYELQETSTGLRPGSPDNGPIVGAVGPPGLIVATGHYRNGILLAPITADEVVRLLTDPTGTRAAGAVADRPFAAFGPGRFGPRPGPVGVPVPVAVDR